MAGAVERAFVASPIASAGGRVIASPFQFYTTGEERLRIVSVNSLTGVRLKVQFRFINSKGTISANVIDHVPATNRTALSEDWPLDIGAVLNVTAFAASGTPQLGQTFVIVQLVRGVGAAAIVLGTLLQGYVTSTQHLGWPGSPLQSSIDGPGCIRAIQGTAPAVGVDWLEAVPTGARWHLLTVFAQFTTNAVVATRLPNLGVASPALGLMVIVPFTGQTASDALAWSWMRGMTVFSFISGSRVDAFLPVDVPLLAGATLGTGTINIQAGDQWGTPILYVREWLEVS